jgi:hypothetical protein
MFVVLRELRSNEAIRGIMVSMGPVKHENVAIFRRKMSGIRMFHRF